MFVGNVRDAARQPVVGALVKLRVASGNHAFGVQCTSEGRSDASGQVRIRGLPAAQFAVDVQHPELVMRPFALRLGPEVTTEAMALVLGVPVEVRGVVRHAGTKAGVERVGIGAVCSDEYRFPLGHAMTDPQGRFVLRLPPGSAALYVSSVPAGFELPPGDSAMVHVAVEKDAAELAKMEFEIAPSPAKR